jgi:lysozyme
MRTDVLDISHYQNVTDQFVTAKSLGVKAIIAKATEGNTYRDPTFEKHRALALDAGLLFGAYHFIRPGDPWAQADFFLKTVGDAGGLALALDWEDTRVPVKDAQRFAERVHMTVGAYPIMYSYASMLKSAAKEMDPKRKTFWRSTKLWVAAYSPAPSWPKDIWPDYWLWQFTGDGSGPQPHRVPGVGDNIDINQYNGDPAKLAFDWATVPGVPKGGIKAAFSPEPEKVPELTGVSRFFHNFFKVR